MNQAPHTVYHLARADFFERTRRYSFLIMLGFAVFIGSQVAMNNLGMQLDEYRGMVNSAWVGGLMSLMGTFFMGWFGFYLVKGSINHDRKTGVGQIMAATPMTRVTYILGKWASNFFVLTILNLILVIIGIMIQFLVGESAQLNLFTIFAPFLFITLPTMALVAAVAVLFESIKFLSGGIGNIVYLFLFAFVADTTDKSDVLYGFDLTGIGILRRSLWAAAEAAYPSFNGGFVIDLQSRLEPVQHIFVWNGVDWTMTLLLQRLALVGTAVLFMMIATFFFDRFETSKQASRKIWPFRWRGKKQAAVSTGNTRPVTSTAPAIQLTPLSAKAKKFNFIHLVNSELKLLLRGVPWWWFVVALLLMIACGIVPLTYTRTLLLPLAWVWPILIWSNMGNREVKHNVHQIAFSSPSPLWRQLSAQWIAGLLVTFATGFGAFLSMVSVGDMSGLLAFLATLLFIPSLALGLGSWSGNNKLFEVFYIFIWYLGPINQLPGLDYMAIEGNGRPVLIIFLSVVLLALAVLGRIRQLTR